MKQIFFLGAGSLSAHIMPDHMLTEFLHYLKSEEKRGVSHVWLDEDARAAMRGLILHKRNTNSAATTSARKPIVVPETLKQTTSEPAAAEMQEIPTIIEPQGNRSEKIAAIKEQLQQWTKGKNLSTLRTTMVFSVGNVDSPIIFVGEAPGYEEEKQREPFVGPAGLKLNDILKAMGLSREQVYITNVSKFRPAMPGQTMNNRPPTLEEMALSLPYLKKEIEVIAPKCIVALGGSAASGLLGLEAANVGSLREKWHEFSDIPLRVTYHPSYLLRTKSAVTEKRKVWEDMLAVMELLKMPISEKQRAFFQSPRA